MVVVVVERKSSVSQCQSRVSQAILKRWWRKKGAMDDILDDMDDEDDILDDIFKVALLTLK